jgi:hypothetical protein
MSISNLFKPNNYDLYSNSLTTNSLILPNSNVPSNFYATTSVTNMKINHYDGASALSDNIVSAVRFIRIGKTIHCRIPAFTTVNVVSGAAENHFLYIWPIPAGYFNSTDAISDLGLQFIAVPSVNQNEVVVDFRYEPNINSASAGITNQPGIAIRTTRNENAGTNANWPANTTFELAEPVTFSYIID